MRALAFGFLFFYGLVFFARAEYLIPMDETQQNHLRGYGLAFLALKAGLPSSWLLNYRGGAFLIEENPVFYQAAVERGVTIQKIGAREISQIRLDIQGQNASEVKLEKCPRIAVYTPPNVNPWADAVTLVLEYAQIPYDKLYDREVLDGKLGDYDWLHLHHEDFTGQYGKFWANYRNAQWYQEKVATFEREARLAGFKTVPQHKLAVAKAIETQVSAGLFLFAMCAATESIDIALASQKIDIVPPEIDGTSYDANWEKLLDFRPTFAFENFKINVSAYENAFSDIDYNQVNTANRRDVTDFILFEFSAKLDPVPTLLNQNHQNRIMGFYGQTTTFRPDRIKDGVTILATSIDGSVRYLYGPHGKGSFTFYGGHSPEDKNHYVGDRSPNLEIHKNSPGYRLILNNILFPSAKPPKKKT